jgi:SHS2 domain-containing protein
MNIWTMKQILACAASEIRWKRPCQKVPGDLESLFVTLLNELLYLREVKATTLVDFHVMRLEQSNEGWVLEGLATGEPLDPDKHEFMTEVKAATYFGLKHYTKGNQHVFQCVVDV